jgi:hypothetical protein
MVKVININMHLQVIIYNVHIIFFKFLGETLITEYLVLIDMEVQID